MPSTYVFSEVESPPRSTLYASRVLINMKSTKEALKFVNILPQLRPVPSFRRSNTLPLAGDEADSTSAAAGQQTHAELAMPVGQRDGAGGAFLEKFYIRSRWLF